MEKKKRRILIGVPCMDMVSAMFTQSLAMLQRPKDCDVAIMLNIGSLVYDSRNQIAKAAIKMEADLVLWIDSDMVFEPDTLVRLLADIDEGRDIVSALCFYRRPPYGPVGYTRLQVENDEIKEMEKITDYNAGEIIEMDAVGFGCVLMKADPLYELAAGEWFMPTTWAGEDCAFCVRAKKEGYSIYLDTNIKLGHMGYLPITESYFRAAQKQMRTKEDADKG